MPDFKPLVREILYIDDDPEDFMMLDEAVRQIAPSVRVTHLMDCPSLLKDPQIPIPDLIFLDINMHASDGFYWLEKLRAKGSQVPVIMFSTAHTDNYVSRAYNLGAQLFLVKPQTYTQLVRSMTDILSMDWSQPEKVTQAHYLEGRFRAYALPT